MPYFKCETNGDLMLTVRTRPCLYNMMQVYEGNYCYLLQLLPDMKEISGTVFSEFNGRPVLFIDVLEQCKYTSMIAVTHYLSFENNVVADMELRLRVYHDARVAEVTSYQHHKKLLPVYSYPNKKMYQTFEKKQVNLFLKEWLEFCVRYGVQFEKIPPAVGVKNINS